MTRATTVATPLIALISLMLLCPAQAPAAENLRLKEGLSFDSDIDKGFPIVADKMEDSLIEPDKPVFIFFGASGDLNTNRQAKRVVDLYKRFKNHDVKFILIDVDRSSAEGRKLIKTYYRGYIPAQVILDKQGKPVWNHYGEVAPQELTGRLEKVL